MSAAYSALTMHSIKSVCMGKKIKPSPPGVMRGLDAAPGVHVYPGEGPARHAPWVTVVLQVMTVRWTSTLPITCKRASRESRTVTVPSSSQSSPSSLSESPPAGAKGIFVTPSGNQRD